MTPQANSGTERGIDTKKKVLVAGASGLIGVAALEAFLSAGWEVVAMSRSKPVLPGERNFEFTSVDLRDERATLGVLFPHDDIAHVADAAICENPQDLVSGWSNAEQIEVNDAMLRNVIELLISGKSTLRHVPILQGTNAYSVHLHPIAIPARETDLRDNHANFFFDREDCVRDTGALRPQLVAGKTPRALDVLPAIGVYAAIRRETGEPFSFPSSPFFVWAAADADLVVQVMLWAPRAPQAANQIFNVSTADVFDWRSVWLAFAETLGVRRGPDQPTSLAMNIRDNADGWSKIVARYGLASTDLRSFVGQGEQHADFAFGYGASSGPVRLSAPLHFARLVSTQRSIPERPSLPPSSHSLIENFSRRRSTSDAPEGSWSIICSRFTDMNRTWIKAAE